MHRPLARTFNTEKSDNVQDSKFADTEYSSSIMSSTRRTTDPVPKTTTWFVHEEMILRTAASLIWQSVLVLLILGTYIICSSTVSWHSSCWIAEALHNILSFQFLWLTFLLQFLFGTLAHTYISTVKVIQPVFLNRLERVKFILNPKRSLRVGQFAFIGLLGAIILLRARGIQLFWQADMVWKSTLNEAAFFIVCLGFFTGLCEGIVFFRKAKFCIKIPVVQEPLVFRIKSALASCAVGIITETFQVLRAFYVLYYLLGTRPRDLVIYTFQLEMQKAAVPLTSLMGLINITLLMDSLTLVLALKFIFRTSSTLFHTFISQIYTFPVEVSFADEVNRTLRDAISSPNELLKSLAVLDFLRISQRKCKRRQQLFMLSQTGGKPVTWTAIRTECETHLRKTLCILEEALRHERRNALSPQEHGTSVVTQSPSWSPCHPTGTSSPGVQEVPLRHCEDSKTKENQEFHLQCLWSELNFTVWIMEGLSCLVSASIKEDEYGVVQKDLSDILALLLRVHEVLESLLRMKGKLNKYSRQRNAEASLPPTLGALVTLKLATETAVYKICTTFGPHISFLKLPTPMKNMLISFTDLKQ